MLKKAGININGLFLNADSGFDSKEFRKICRQKGVEANIDANSKNSKNELQTDNHQYFDEELYKKCGVID